MRVLKMAAAAAVMLGCALSATADPSAPKTPAATEQAPPVAADAPKQAAQPDQAKLDSERVCKTLKVIGSRTRGERLCKTRKQWRQEEEAARKAMDENSRRALQACMPTAGGGCGG
jgi:hypothetical protein